MARIILESADTFERFVAESVTLDHAEATFPDGTAVRVVKAATGQRREIWRDSNGQDYYRSEAR